MKRVAKVDALQWVNGEQAAILIESLKKWAMRFLPEQVQALSVKVLDAIYSGTLQLPPEDVDALRFLIGVAQTRQTFDPMQSAWIELSKALKGDAQ